MSKRLWRVAGLVFGSMLLASTAVVWAGQQQPDDATITSNIQARLFQDSVLKTRDIHVTTQGGVVTLSGSVHTDLEKSAVDRIASTEPGVKQVVDSLTVGDETRRSSRSAADSSADAGQAGGQAAGQAGGLTIPAGTVVTVRMIDSIDSSRNQPGQEFDATVDSPVAVGDRVLIPKNANAKVRLVNAQSAGRIKGNAELELQLVSVTVKGTPYNVESGYYQQHGASRSRRSAETIGGGAALGAIIGAIAGGRKGTAIGAGTGAAAGTVAQVATKGASVKVPSETKLDFTLKSPVAVQP
jgi:BON domain